MGLDRAVTQVQRFGYLLVRQAAGHGPEHVAFAFGDAGVHRRHRRRQGDELGREAGIVTLVLIAATALWVATWRTGTAPAGARTLPGREARAAL